MRGLAGSPTMNCGRARSGGSPRGCFAMSHEFSKIEEALEALAAGRLVIVVDDEDRENEGDFIGAAERVTPEMIAFMIEHGRGQVCMPIMPELADRLGLHP